MSDRNAHAASSRRRTQNTIATNSASTIAEESQAPEQPRQRRARGDDPTPNAMDFMKSFKVSMDEPCRNVLPVALKKYHIDDDWRQYSLYIVHGDQERCLGLQEKPLILFKQLVSENKKPMFMLRKHAGQEIPGDGGGSGPAGVGSLPGGATRTSYAPSTVQLPGGML